MDILVENIFKNSFKIDQIINHINKNEKQIALAGLLLTFGMYCVTKVVSKQEERINILEEKLEEIKSKGE